MPITNFGNIPLLPLSPTNWQTDETKGENPTVTEVANANFASIYRSNTAPQQTFLGWLAAQEEREKMNALQQDARK